MKWILDQGHALKNGTWGNRVGEVAEKTMMHHLVKMNNGMFGTFDNAFMFIIMNFFFHLGKKEDQQDKDR